MDGTLEVRSREGHGSTFTLRLPAAEPRQPAAPATARPLIAVQSGLDIRVSGRAYDAVTLAAHRVSEVPVEVVYTPVIGACLTMFRVMNWDVRVSGTEHLPASGPGVVATNHVGYMDFIFVGAAVRQQNKRRLRFLAKKEVFDHPVAGPMMRSMRHIPVDRDGQAATAMDHARQALRDGEVIGMFPEATISPSFVPLPGKTGSVRLAMETGAPLIPGAVWGSQRLMTKWRPRNLQRGVVITVDFGPPLDYSADEDPQAVHERLMAAIGELVDRAQSRYPQVPSGDDDRWWLPAHLGGTAPTPDEAAARLAASRQKRRRDAGA